MTLKQLTDILADACHTKERYADINKGVCIFITTHQGTDQETTYRLGITNRSGPGHKRTPFEQAVDLVTAIKNGTHCTAMHQNTRIRLPSQ